MPCIDLKTNVAIKDSDVLKAKLGKAIEKFPGKSEAWLMVEVQGDYDMRFAGKDDPCAMVACTILREPNRNACEKFTEEVTSIIEEELDIPGDRIYVSVVSTNLWSWNGGLF